MIISLVAAASENNVIGKDGKIPWHLPNDFRHFGEVTMGKPVVMGRKTRESIGRVLPGRRNIVVTRGDTNFEGCDTVHSVKEAIELVRNAAEVCIIGGGEIYRQALPLANRIDLTRVHTVIEGGDAFFPKFNPGEWELKSEERHEADSRHEFAYTFLVYERKAG